MQHDPTNLVGVPFDDATYVVSSTPPRPRAAWESQSLQTHKELAAEIAAALNRVQKTTTFVQHKAEARVFPDALNWELLPYTFADLTSQMAELCGMSVEAFLAMGQEWDE